MTMKMKIQEQQSETEQQEPSKTKPTFESLINTNINIFNNQELNKQNCDKFKEVLKEIKQIYNKDLSREFFLREYKGTANAFKQRYKRLLDKTELKTQEKIKEHKQIISKNGYICLELTNEIFSFFIVDY